MPPEILLDGRFDSGSLDEKRSHIRRDLITLVGRDNFYPDQWKWLYFKASNVAGRHLTFQINNRFIEGSDRLVWHKMVYSYDQDTWHFFDHGHHDAEAGIYRFHNEGPFIEPDVYIAYSMAYPMQRITELMGELVGSPWVRPTPSGNADLVLGRSAGGMDDIGRTIPSHPLYGFQISDGGDDANKVQIVLLGGVHPNETLANYTLEGLIRFLIGSSAEADALRKAATFLIYPMVNPDGRYAGFNRTTVQHPDRDANRYWRHDLCTDMDDIRCIVEALHADTRVPVDYFIDFHCWSDTTHHFGILSFEEGYHQDAFWLHVRRLEPTVSEMDSGFANWSSETFGVKCLKAKFCMTFETMFIPGENIDRFLRLGRNFGLAFYHVLHGAVLS